MTAIVRHFNGTSTDHLDTLLASGALNAMSAGGWVKRDALGSRVGLIGRALSAVNQWSFYQFEGSDALVYHVNNAGTSKVAFSAAVDTASAWIWVGFTRAWPSGVVKFYTGDTPGSLTLLPNLGVDVDIQAPNGSGQGTQLGGVSTGNLISVGWWNGYMDQWNYWLAELSQGELEASMTCGAVIRPADAVFIVPIIGASPEPTVSFGGVADLTVNGTTVLSQDGIGCETVNGPVPVPEVPPVAIAPPLSGGPGGGINNPGTIFDDGSTGGNVGIAGAQVFKEPDFGHTMAKGFKPTMGKSLLGQRLAPAYRSLDHLAATLKRRKK